MPKKSSEQKKINLTVMNNQIQKRALCGYFACDFATALRFNVDIEKLNFNESFLISLDSLYKRKKKRQCFNVSISYNQYNCK